MIDEKLKNELIEKGRRFMHGYHDDDLTADDADAGAGTLSGVVVVHAEAGDGHTVKSAAHEGERFAEVVAFLVGVGGDEDLCDPEAYKFADAPGDGNAPVGVSAENGEPAACRVFFETGTSGAAQGRIGGKCVRQCGFVKGPGVSVRARHAGHGKLRPHSRGKLESVRRKNAAGKNPADRLAYRLSCISGSAPVPRHF